MTAAAATKPDRRRLAHLLRAAHSPLDPDGVAELIAGVLAAPEDIGASWPRLVADPTPPALAEALEELRAHMAAGYHDGLSREDFARLPRPTRLARLREVLVARRLDGFIVPRADEYQGEYVPPAGQRLAWLTGFTGSAGLAIVLRDRAALFVDGRYTLQAAAQVDTALLEIRGGDVPHTPLPLSFAILRQDGSVNLFIDRRKLAPGLDRHLGNAVTIEPPDRLGPALDELARAGERVQVDPGTAASWIFDRLTQAGGRIHRAADPCLLPKACKNPVELDGTRAAHRRDGAAVTRFLAWLAREAPKGELREIAASDRLEAFRREGELFRDLSFPTISGAGPNGAIVHYRAMPETERRLEAGTLYLLDSGAQYLDGTTDITRTIAIGTPTDEMRDRFTRVLKGHIALALARFPKGTTGSQLDAFARRALWEEGLDYDHGTGHGVGSYLGVHEGPQRISKAVNTQALLPGMIVSNEPGYYKTGGYGIRIENLVVVQPWDGNDGARERDMLCFETLTLAPIDRTLISRDLLDDAEIAWLDAYHARVRDTLTPVLDRDTARWLVAATQPF